MQATRAQSKTPMCLRIDGPSVPSRGVGRPILKELSVRIFYTVFRLEPSLPHTCLYFLKNSEWRMSCLLSDFIFYLFKMGPRVLS